jgi:hypothetical protein
MLRLPYKVTLQPSGDPASGDTEIFSVVINATDSFDARTWIHSMYNAEIISIHPQPVHRFRVVEHDIQFNLDSIIYSSDDELDATTMMEHLRKAWLSGTRYTFHIQTA